MVTTEWVPVRKNSHLPASFSRFFRVLSSLTIIVIEVTLLGYYSAWKDTMRFSWWRKIKKRKQEKAGKNYDWQEEYQGKGSNLQLNSRLRDATLLLYESDKIVEAAVTSPVPGEPSPPPDPPDELPNRCKAITWSGLWKASDGLLFPAEKVSFNFSSIPTPAVTRCINRRPVTICSIMSEKYKNRKEITKGEMKGQNMKEDVNRQTWKHDATVTWKIRGMTKYMTKYVLYDWSVFRFNIDYTFMCTSTYSCFSFQKYHTFLPLGMREI